MLIRETFLVTNLFVSVKQFVKKNPTKKSALQAFILARVSKKELFFFLPVL